LGAMHPSESSGNPFSTETPPFNLCQEQWQWQCQCRGLSPMSPYKWGNVSRCEFKVQQTLLMLYFYCLEKYIYI